MDGTGAFDGGYILNTGDVGLLKSLEKLSAADASRSTNDGATIAAHVQHERYGLSLMNRWATEGGNPFADAKWDEAWKTREVDARAWDEIRNGFAGEARRWLDVLQHAARGQRDRAQWHGREHRPPGVSHRRHPSDRQADARAQRGHVYCVKVRLYEPSASFSSAREAQAAERQPFLDLRDVGAIVRLVRLAARRQQRGLGERVRLHRPVSPPIPTRSIVAR